MTTYCSANKPTRRRVALPLLVLHAIAVALAPIAHGNSEVLSTERSVEAAHTNQCVQVHRETVCTFGANSQAAHVEGRVLQFGALPHRIAAPSVARMGSHRGSDPTFNRQRAPPAL